MYTMIYMRTISTKLPKDEHERLLELCNQEGQSVSEIKNPRIVEI